MTTQKSAKELLSDMATMQMALRQTCPHCQQTTLRFITDDTCHCINPQCGAYMLTMNVDQFITMTPEKVSSYANCKRSTDSLEDGQREFEKREAEIKAAAAKRAECRARGEKCFG